MLVKKLNFDGFSHKNQWLKKEKKYNWGEKLSALQRKGLLLLSP